MELYMGCTDVDQNIASLTIICCGLLGVLKMAWFRIYAKNLIDNYNSALNDYLTIENTKERDIMRKHAFIGRFLCCSMLGFCYFGCVMYGIIPLLDYDKSNQIKNENMILEYGLPSRCALEYFNFPTSMYEISCFFETVIMILAATANVGNIYLCLDYTYRFEIKIFVFKSLLIKKFIINLLMLLILCTFFG